MDVYQYQQWTLIGLPLIERTMFRSPVDVLLSLEWVSQPGYYDDPHSVAVRGRSFVEKTIPLVVVVAFVLLWFIVSATVLSIKLLFRASSFLLLATGNHSSKFDTLNTARVFVFGLLESKEAALPSSSVTAAGLLLFTRFLWPLTKHLEMMLEPRRPVTRMVLS